MKIVCKGKVIDLSKYETVKCRESLLGSSQGYPVEATRKEVSKGLFGGTYTASEEIARFVHRKGAEALVGAITNAWINGDSSFDVEKWRENVNVTNSNQTTNNVAKVNVLNYINADNGKSMDIYVFKHEVDIEAISKYVGEIFEEEGGTRPYSDIIKDKFGDLLIDVADKKEIIW